MYVCVCVCVFWQERQEKEGRRITLMTELLWEGEISKIDYFSLFYHDMCHYKKSKCGNWVRDRVGRYRDNRQSVKRSTLAQVLYITPTG